MDRETEELLCDIQAQLSAQRSVLRALARTHPDPEGLLAAWRETSIEDTRCNPVAPAHARNSRYLAERVRACVEDWTAEFVEMAIREPKLGDAAGDRAAPPTY